MSEIIVEGGPPPIPRERVIDLIRSYLGGTEVIRAFLFGSYATGLADATSDVDLLLVEPVQIPFTERGRTHLPLFRMGFGLDLLIYTPEEFQHLMREGNPLIERVCREGIEIYARSEG